MSYRTLFSLPNLLTLSNLCCGSTGIWFACHHDTKSAFYFMILAAVMDFFDGMAARLLKISHPIGKDLDSLADVVSFGVLPGMMCMSFLIDHHHSFLISLLAMMIPACSALRLAKFNHDSRQSVNFIGVPTPMNGLSWASLLYPSAEKFALQHPVYVWSMIFISSFLLISEIPMPSLKGKPDSFKTQPEKYAWIILILPCLLLFGWNAFAVSYWLYVLTGFYILWKNRSIS
ncbi:MAG: CDP-diacylglycerol--serine O-phosphatidyltransferase [Bacteroidia bacterium]|nr:CDP-diacylglycerol--serine O-phosphatidyltransferase [Bacteroidia bacterium]